MYGARLVAFAAVMLLLAACTDARSAVPDRPDSSGAQSNSSGSNSSGSNSSGSQSTESMPSAPTPTEPTRDDLVQQRVASMSLSEKAGQLLVVNFDGTKAPEQLIENIEPGGLIYFSDNLTSSAQITAMSKQSQHVSRSVGQPLLVMTDQEGGPVTRVPGTSDVAGGAEFKGNTAAALKVARSIGANLKSLGINVDLAPVADVNTAGDAGVIKARSFSSDPDVVSEMVEAQVCGFHEGGMAAAAKHFPGHGSTAIDSHERTATIKRSKSQWERIDLPPFVAAEQAHVDLILVGHLAFPAIDPSGRPATISQPLNEGLLRDRLGFDGVVMTDALNMGGITSWGSPGQIAVKAIAAGSDMLLMSPDPAAAAEAIVDAVERGNLSAQRLDDSVIRVLKLKQEVGLYDVEASLPSC